MNTGYIILFVGIAILSYIVQANLQSKFKKFSKMPLDGGITGRDVAIKMLHDNGIYDRRHSHRPLQPHEQDRKPERGSIQLVQCGSSCCSSTRVWTRPAARPGICTLEDAFGTRTFRVVCIVVDDLDTAHWYHHRSEFSPDTAGRNSTFRIDHTVQFHHTARGD